MIDENEFFREVSIGICGSLKIDRALLRCFQFVSRVMPVDELIISVYDRETGCARIIATADSLGARLVSEEISLAPASRREIEKAGQFPRTRKAMSQGEDQIVNRLANHLGWPLSSVLVNRLTIDGGYVGAFIARAKGEEKYMDEHVRAWALVNEPAAIALANHQEYEETNRLKDLLADDKQYLQCELRKGLGERLIGADFGLKEVMDKVRRVAPLPSPILLIGETGTGKEIIANAIHDLSNRNDGPLIKVNCGAIPETLVDSELFGHEKGAFTGAIAQKRGRFERAQGGTIFLDEVSELLPQAQVRLLRVLQEKEIERVGGTKPVKVDARIVSATNRDLESLVGKGQFREDLYFRLSVFPISVPPLRERRNDIPAFVHYFIFKKAREMVMPLIPTLAPGEIDRLMAYDWPGNVRELENAVERAIILSDPKHVTFADTIGRPAPSLSKDGSLGEQESERLDQVEVRHIEAVLKKTAGKVSGQGNAAELLGINPNTLRHRMRKLGIRFGRR
ncbi:MAG: Formate hydrogenlyase transcriptional activator [Syntrophorhabdus sp. PtaU1.Bin050]|nr:MAG: Formate hydrogenlyase transcriptional activator [Syntrophorhabdus sp. PtaU1.Bin050]